MTEPVIRYRWPIAIVLALVGLLLLARASKPVEAPAVDLARGDVPYDGPPPGETATIKIQLPENPPAPIPHPDSRQGGDVPPTPSVEVPEATPSQAVEEPAETPAIAPPATDAPATIPAETAPSETPAETPAESAPPAIDRAALTRDYVALVRAEVGAEKHYPAQAKRLKRTGTATARLTINADGSLASVVLQSSAGTESLDNAALEAIRAAAPFPAIPDGLHAPLTIELPLQFSLE
ncbi:MAG: TonB family protein [bacterium]